MLGSVCFFTLVVCALSSGDKGRWSRSYDRSIPDEAALIRAKAVLSRYPLVDGHNDMPWQYRDRISNQVSQVDLTRDVNSQWGPSHTDIPRLREGHLGGQFWVAYVSCTTNHKDAVRQTLEQIDVIKRIIDQYPDDFQLVTTSTGIEEAFADGKIGGLIAVEGGHGLDSSIASLRMSYHLGVRLMTLTHSCSLPWGDSSTADDTNADPPNWGLSSFGKTMVTEMNRLGMIIDISHTSRKTQLDAIERSRAPVVFSHSNVWSLSHRTRNVHDDVIIKMAQKGGVLMVTFVGSFLDYYPGNYTTADIPMVADPPDVMRLDEVQDHIEYVRNLVGVNHVGIGGDYDGTSRLALGLEDVSKYPDLFAELVQRGWSDDDLEKLAGRNLVRVFREVEFWVPNEMELIGMRPKDIWVPQNDLDNIDPDNQCRTLE